MKTAPNFPNFWAFQTGPQTCWLVEMFCRVTTLYKAPTRLRPLFPFLIQMLDSIISSTHVNLSFLLPLFLFFFIWLNAETQWERTCKAPDLISKRVSYWFPPRPCRRLTPPRWRRSLRLLKARRTIQTWAAVSSELSSMCLWFDPSVLERSYFCRRNGDEIKLFLNWSTSDVFKEP